MATRGKAAFPVKSSVRGAQLHFFQFDTNGTSDPDGLVDPGGIVSSVAYAATGTYVVTLKQRYRYIFPFQSHQDATVGTLAAIGAVTDGLASANAITVRTEYQNTATQTAAATTDKCVSVAFFAFD